MSSGIILCHRSQFKKDKKMYTSVTFLVPFSFTRTFCRALFVALEAAFPDQTLPEGCLDLKVLSLA